MNQINFKRIILGITFAAISLWFFGTNAEITKAVTAEDLLSQIIAIQEQVKELQELLEEIQTTTSWCHDFKTNFGYGSKGSEVKVLHIALEKEGFTISAEEKANSYFGDYTASAVVGFQEKYKTEILESRGLLRGTGYIDESTRKKLNELYGCVITLPLTFSISFEPISVTTEEDITLVIKTQPMDPWPDGYGSTHAVCVTRTPCFSYDECLVLKEYHLFCQAPDPSGITKKILTPQEREAFGINSTGTHTVYVGCSRNDSARVTGGDRDWLDEKELTNGTFTVIIPEQTQPFNFSLASNPSIGTVNIGNSISTSITATLISGTSQTVSLSASTSDPTISFTWIGNTCNPTCSRTLVITAGATTTLGTHTITVTGTGVGIPKTTTFSLKVLKSESEYACPDLNRDSVVNILDVSLLTQKIGACEGSPNYNSTWDVNGDGCLTQTDLDFVSKYSGKNTVDIPQCEEIKPELAFDFSLSLSPTSRLIAKGQSTSTSVTATLISGTSQTVSLSASTSDPTISFTWIGNTCNPTCSRTLVITAGATTTLGTHTITVTGTGGSMSRKVTFSLTVTIPPPTGTCSVSLEKSTYNLGETIIIDYANAPENTVLFLLNPTGTNVQSWLVSGSSSKIYTLLSNSPVGSWSALLWNLPICNKETKINVSPALFDFSLAVSSASLALTQDGSVSTTIKANLVSGTSQSVSFSLSGLPTGTSYSLSQNSCYPTCSTTLTIKTGATTPAGTYNVTITGTTGGMSREVFLTLTVEEIKPPIPMDFSLSVSSVSASIAKGQSTSTSVTATLISGTSQTVSLSASTSDPTISFTWIGNTCNPTCSRTLVITAGATTTLGTHTITVTGTGVGIPKTTTFSLKVLKSESEYACPDLNRDSVVNILDVSLLTQKIGACEGSPNYNSTWDVNGDGCLTQTDLDFVSKYSGKNTVDIPQCEEIKPELAFDFSLSKSPSSASIQQGDSASTKVSATLIAGTTKTVTFSASTSDPTISFTWIGNTCNPTCSRSLVVTTTSTTLVKTHTITITATGGGKTKTTIFSLIVSAKPKIESEYNCPDLNGDGVVNITDIAIVSSHINTCKGDANYDSRGDVNSDNCITQTDLDFVSKYNGKTTGEIEQCQGTIARQGEIEKLLASITGLFDQLVQGIRKLFR